MVAFLSAPIGKIAGDDWHISFHLKLPAGTPMDLTGYTITAIVEYGDAFVGCSAIPDDLTNGRFHFLLSAAQTAEIPPNDWARVWLQTNIAGENRTTQAIIDINVMDVI